MFCPNCGTEGTGNFCTNCGNPFNVQSAAPQIALRGKIQNVIDRRLCNALIKDAEPDFEAFLLFAEIVGLEEISKPIKSIKSTMSIAKKLLDGLWVGGTSYLTRDAIIFRPNLLNRILHKQDCSVVIPLNRISGITKRSGFVTQIIDIIVPQGTLSIRCYWPTSFIDAINSQISQLRGIDLNANPTGA